MKIGIVLALFSIIIFACGAGGPEGPANYNNDEAKKLFKRYCSTCHGIDGKMGLNGAKDLALSTLNYDQRVILISNGKGAMNGFKGMISDEEIAQLAKYSLNFKNPE